MLSDVRRIYVYVYRLSQIKHKLYISELNRYLSVLVISLECADFLVFLLVLCDFNFSLKGIQMKLMVLHNELMCISVVGSIMYWVTFLLQF